MYIYELNCHRQICEAWYLTSEFNMMPAEVKPIETQIVKFCW